MKKSHVVRIRKNKALLRLPAFALALLAGTALAQSVDQTTLDQALTQEQGMTRSSDGFYEKTVNGTQSYVATSPAGKRTLAAKVTAIRAGVPANSDLAHDLDKVLSSLNSARSGALQAKNQAFNGYCTGYSNPNGPLYVMASAGGGIGGSPYGASAQAINGTSPLIHSSNIANADVYDQEGNTRGTQHTTTYDATQAIASAYSNAGCYSASAAEITCSGYSSSLTAVAYNTRTNPVSCSPQ